MDKKYPDIAKAMNLTAAHAKNILDNDSLSHITKYIYTQVNPDGGFKGRDSRSDLYYSLFGLECMQALDITPDWKKVENFLIPFYQNKSLDFIHLICLIRCFNKIPGLEKKREKQITLFKRLNNFMDDDNGYKLSATDKYNSVYAAFLAFLSSVESQIGMPRLDALMQCIEKAKSMDNAYASQPGLRNGTVTVTAAASLLISNFEHLKNNNLFDWLFQQYSPHGGFRASPLAPIPDLLSTGTALFALHYQKIDLAKIKKQTFDFVESVWHDNGGFCGHLFEEKPDIEYTFYGLLSLGVLSELE